MYVCVCVRVCVDEILLFEGHLVLYKSITDVNLYVLSSKDENELIVLSVLKALEGSLNHLLRYVNTYVCLYAYAYVYVYI